MQGVLSQQVLLAFSWHSVFPGASFKSAVGRHTASLFSNANGGAPQSSPLSTEGQAPQFAGRPFKGYFEGNKNTRVSQRRDKAKPHPFPQSGSLSLMLVDGSSCEELRDSEHMRTGHPSFCSPIGEGLAVYLCW